MNWEQLYNDLMSLMREENALAAQEAPSHVMSASGLYEGHGECGLWFVQFPVTESLQQRFVLFATKAGKGLGPAPGVKPINLWLHRVFLYLREMNSKILDNNNEDGLILILRVIEASMMYAARLAAESLDREQLGIESPEAGRIRIINENLHAQAEMEARRQFLVKRHLQELESQLPGPSTQQTDPPESIGEQIEKLREECRYTVEELAEELDIQPRSVYRHLSGEAIPRNPHLGAYERIFSKRLGRKVLIAKTSGKRQQ